MTIIIKNDFFSLMNTNFYRISVGYQRTKLKEILRDFENKNKIVEGRLNKKILSSFEEF